MGTSPGFLDVYRSPCGLEGISWVDPRVSRVGIDRLWSSGDRHPACNPGFLGGYRSPCGRPGTSWLDPRVSWLEIYHPAVVRGYHGCIPGFPRWV